MCVCGEDPGSYIYLNKFEIFLYLMPTDPDLTYFPPGPKLRLEARLAREESRSPVITLGITEIVAGVYI